MGWGRVAGGGGEMGGGRVRQTLMLHRAAIYPSGG